jgi:hypothetical protein
MQSWMDHSSSFLCWCCNSRCAFPESSDQRHAPCGSALARNVLNQGPVPTISTRAVCLGVAARAHRRVTRYRRARPGSGGYKAGSHRPPRPCALLGPGLINPTYSDPTPQASSPGAPAAHSDLAGCVPTAGSVVIPRAFRVFNPRPRPAARDESPRSRVPLPPPTARGAARHATPCPLVAAARLRPGRAPAPPPHRDELQLGLQLGGICNLFTARTGTASHGGRRSCPAPARSSRHSCCWLLKPHALEGALIG